MSAPSAASFPVPGSTWLDTYDILDTVADSSSGQSWKARVSGSSKTVQIRLAKALDGGRSKAWDLLCSVATTAPMLRPHARHEVADRFFEVYDLPAASALVSWRQKRGILSESELTTCLRQIAESVSALHKVGLVHLALKPEAFYVEEEDDGKFRIILGGLELVTLRDQEGLIQIPVEPLYAPPEAAGLFKHPPGDRLITWDSFSLGRVVQFLFLGKHVLSLILNRDITSVTPELRERAEMLAFERLDGHLRAGALEAMDELPPRLNTLLRGLLTSSWEARWRDEEIASWLGGATPLEHYSLPTKERCYRHAGQSCTIAEAAEQLRTAEHWDEATNSVFDHETPGTLAAFIQEEASEALKRKMEVINNLFNDSWMAQFPPQALRDSLTALALQQLSGDKLYWRGKRVDATLLLEMLEREEGSGQWLARARILSCPPVLVMLDNGDTEAARVLGEIGRHAKKAEDRARKQSWLSSTDIHSSASIWKLSCQLQNIPSIIANLRAHYACSTQADPQALFTLEKPGIDEQLLLCHMAAKPPAYGFLSHEEFAALRYDALYKEGLLVAEMLFWKRLRLALATGPWWFGRIWWLAAGWGLFALLFAFIKPGPGWLAVACLPAVLALGMRGLLLANLQPLLSIHFPKAPSWHFLDGPSRCNAANNELRTSNELHAILTNINTEIGSLTALTPPPSKVIVPPRFSGLRTTALCSWLILLGLLGYLGWQASLNPPSLQAFQHAWASKPEDLEALAAQTDDNEPNDTRIIWPHTKSPSEPKSIIPLQKTAASPKQEAIALRAGSVLLAKYLRNTITVPILIKLPSETHFVYALYDGKKRSLASKNVFTLSYQPMPRTWIEIDGIKVYVYVD